jgi:Putative Ig domain/Divergent InlB B-repeat domain
LTANFVPATTLTVTISGPGTVNQGFGGVTMQPLGSTATIVATPHTGARFLGWSGDVASQQASINVTLNQPVNLTATFATIVLPTLTSPAILNVNEGAAVNYTPTAAESGVTWSATNLPSGLTLDTQTGAITGAVAVAGNYSVPVTATDI